MASNNKWKNGKVVLELSQLPPLIIGSPGIKPVSTILDKKIGEEIILLITEPRDNVKEFEKLRKTNLEIKVGLVNTSFGPICWLLFYFPVPQEVGQVTYENTLNPKSYEQLSIYKKLSSQKYWHVVIADNSGEVFNFFEFPNSYGLLETISQVENVCLNMQVTDFMAGKAEYEKMYSIEQLLAL